MDGCLGRDIILYKARYTKWRSFSWTSLTRFRCFFAPRSLSLCSMWLQRNLVYSWWLMMYRPGGNSSLVLVGTCPWEFEIGSIHRPIPTLHEKVTHSYTNRPILGQILTKLPDFFSSNFLIILIYIGLLVPKFALNKGSLIYQEADFATHVSGTFP